MKTGRTRPIRRSVVADVMTMHIHVLSQTTPFKTIVRMIEDNHISGLPVVDAAGRVIGVVSEASLLLKGPRRNLEQQQRPPDSRRDRRERHKAAGLTAVT